MSVDQEASTPSEVVTGSPSFLLSQLGSHVGGVLTDRLAALGVLPREFGLINCLAGSEGQTQQGLADTLRIHRNSMVALVDELESRGLVVRRRHPADRRAYALYLTERGRELHEQALRVASGYNAELLGALEVADRATLVRLLRRLVEYCDLPPGVHPNLAGPSRGAR